MNAELKTAYATALPCFWGANEEPDGSILITECDEPTFRITDAGVAWAKPMEEIKALFRDEDQELAEAWETEAIRVFNCLTSIFQQASSK